MVSTLKQKLTLLFRAIVESTWFAYVSIVLLQVKVMLQIWVYRDLTPGDNSLYYPKVFTWLDEAKVDLVWSPVYTIFLATLHSLIENPFWVLIVAQMSVAISASLLILALMRRLLPNYIAWIIAAWWTLLPINFDSVYNVHLFSALFPLVILVIAAYTNNTIYGRGFVLGGLLLTAMLVRFEYIVLFLFWLMAIAGYELYVYRQKNSSPSLRTYVSAYGLPILTVLLIIGVFFTRSTHNYTDIKEAIEIEHALTIGQAYSFNRFQQGDTVVEQKSLLERDFKRSTITSFQAFFLNPRAMLEHIWWNIKLIPNGTQLALFNYYTGGPNPDYMPRKHSFLAWVPFLYVIGFSIFGVFTYFILPSWRKHQSIENKFVWLLMFSTALLVLWIIMLQRPRPSLMFLYSMFIMALTGLGLHGILELLGVCNTVKTWWPIGGILLILFVPSYYDADYINHSGYKGQVLRENYKRVAPHVRRSSLLSPAVLVTPLGDYDSLCNYLGVTCRTLALEGNIIDDRMMQQISASPDDALEENVYILYLEEMIWEISSISDETKSALMDYVELHCFSLANNIITCSDGHIDLNRGIMNDGTREIPLRAALIVNDGYVINQRNYRTDRGYYLQVIMRNGKIYMILVADNRLFWTNINQQYLLGNYDKHYFEEVYNNFPMIRILKVKRADAADSTR